MTIQSGGPTNRRNRTWRYGMGWHETGRYRLPSPNRVRRYRKLISRIWEHTKWLRSRSTHVHVHVPLLACYSQYMYIFMHKYILRRSVRHQCCTKQELNNRIMRMLPTTSLLTPPEPRPALSLCLHCSRDQQRTGTAMMTLMENSISCHTSPEER